MVNDYHTPVLVDAVLQYLPTKHDGIYVDGTLGGGGHAEKILVETSPHGKLIGFDVDEEALIHARNRLRQFGDRVMYFQDNYSNVHTKLKSVGIERIHGLLIDLGVSSRQLDEIDRGFSFQQDSRLDMRMNRSQSLDAWMVVNTYDKEQLSRLFWEYGEERNSRHIAKRVTEARLQGPINTTRDLAGIVAAAVGNRFLTKSMARIFQAIRIEVNNELASLELSLDRIVDLLAQGGRIVVISYHSLEDRIVKNFFKKESQREIPSGTPLLPAQRGNPRLNVLTK